MKMETKNASHADSNREEEDEKVPSSYFFLHKESRCLWYNAFLYTIMIMFCFNTSILSIDVL